MRSLILAGGGIKVGYQAGCLQVLLDEAEIRFDHVDGASGGCFNAAMIANGMTGTEIANAWRRLNPFDMVSFNVGEYYKIFWARSIASLDSLRKKVFPAWGLDWNRIRSCRAPVVTFNVYDFTHKRLLVLENKNMDEDYLAASVALPMWFPPIQRNGVTLFDAVYCTDANVGEGVRRGADEMWSIWTVADKPEYRDGFLAQYFHIIETVADTRFFRDWEEVQAVNLAIERHGLDATRSVPDLQIREGYLANAGLRPPPGRKRIDLHLIKQEVPIHYLINLSQDRMAETVEMGVRDARRYCEQRGINLKRLAAKPQAISLQRGSEQPVGLSFTEVMKGYFDPQATDPCEGERNGREVDGRISFQVTIQIDDLDRFIREPEHCARATGWVDARGLGGRLPLTKGTFNLFVTQEQEGPDDPAQKKMVYELAFTLPSGEEVLLHGAKIVVDDPGLDVWEDLTRLEFVLKQNGNGGPRSCGAGVLRIGAFDFMRQLTTFRVTHTHSPVESVQVLTRFGRFFIGQAWDVYARFFVDYAPF